AGIEFTQLWFPPRVSSLNDIVAETLGAAVGISLWIIAGQRVTTLLRQLWSALAVDGWAARVLPVYLGVLMLLHSWPLDLTIRPSDLWHKYQAGRIHLIPFVVAQPPWDMAAKQLRTVLLFLPVGLLLARLQSSLWRQWGAWLRVLLIGV